MQNFRGSVKGARTSGKLSMPMGKGTVAPTDNNDGQPIAHILTDETGAAPWPVLRHHLGPDR